MHTQFENIIFEKGINLQLILFSTPVLLLIKGIKLNLPYINDYND
jgi:hypothetical protein